MRNYAEQSVAPARPRGTISSTRRRIIASLAPLLVLLLLWQWLLAMEGAYRGGPGGKAWSADFAMFVAASQVAAHGGNPYDHATLLTAESELLRRQHLSSPTVAANVRVGNPPLFIWLLGPLARLPYQPAAYAWMTALLLASLGGLLCLLRSFSWRSRLVPSLVFALMPQTTFGIFYGNPIGIAFAGLSAGLMLAGSQPFTAGALLSVAWLKPPVALPAVLLIALFHAPRRGRLLLGFTAATAVGLALTLLTSGPSSLFDWARGLFGYTHSMGTQPDLASLVGLYVRWAPANLRLALEATSIAAALLLTAVTWWRHRFDRNAGFPVAGWLWVVWLLASPYGHFGDEILLTGPFLTFLGQDGQLLSGTSRPLALYLLFFSLLLISWFPHNVQLLSLPLLPLALMLFAWGRTPFRADGGEPAWS